MIGAVTTKVHVKREIILDPITAFENHSKKSHFTSVNSKNLHKLGEYFCEIFFREIFFSQNKDFFVNFMKFFFYYYFHVFFCGKVRNYFWRKNSKGIFFRELYSTFFFSTIIFTILVLAQNFFFVKFFH